MLQITTKDPAIRLFGQKIPLPGDPDLLTSVSGDNLHKAEQEQDEEDENYADDDEGLELDEFHKDPGSENVTEKDQEEEHPPSKTGETKNSSTSSPDAIANPKTPSIEEEASKSKSDKSEKEQQQGEAGGNSQDQKTLKKPDKLLPCPRCNSMDTKFCYYNNYNVNQPRYFCKACQRYWTAGGTMRNVPVGAGRRKNKSSASAARHITISEALQAARIDAPNGSRVLSFGLDHQKPLNGTRRNGFEEQQRFPTIHSKSEENGDDSSTSIGKSGGNGFIIPSVPWPYAALCPSGFPLPFYPPAFWNWNVNPWFSSASNPNSPTLGKHSRDGDMIKHDSMEKEEPPKQRNGCVLVPKTLRIDDPNEAAKSSIWATLGIKKESAVSGGGMFKAFQSNKEVKKNHHVEASPMLMANPAALSRSLNFHENS